MVICEVYKGSLVSASGLGLGIKMSRKLGPESGKIYFISSDEVGMLYIGYTCKTLSERFTMHVQDMEAKVNKVAVEMSRYSNLKINLLEDYPCDSFEELIDRQVYYIQKHSDTVLNKRGKKVQQRR